MRLAWATLLPLLVFAAGCRPPSPAVYVDLSKVPIVGQDQDWSVDIRAVSVPPLPSAVGALEPVEGASILLSDTSERVRAARELIDRNREQALRGLTAALYRAYSREAQTERTLRERELEKDSVEIWMAAHDRISALLQEHAGDRFPLANHLAFLIDFPFDNPAERPKPENPVDLREHNTAVALWNQLLAEDREFAVKVQAILDEVQAALDARRVQIQVDLARALNAAADRSAEEARRAVESRLPDFVGTLVARSDIHIPPLPAETISLPPVPTPPLRVEPPDRPLGALRQDLLEQDLAIWLAQKGYVRAKSPSEGLDRTQEFAAWIKARKAGI